MALETEVSALKRAQVNQDGNTWSVRNHKNLDKSQVLNMDLNVKPSSPVCHPSLRPKLKPSSRPGNLNISRKNAYSAYDMSHCTWLEPLRNISFYLQIVSYTPKIANTCPKLSALDKYSENWLEILKWSRNFKRVFGWVFKKSIWVTPKNSILLFLAEIRLFKMYRNIL